MSTFVEAGADAEAEAPTHPTHTSSRLKALLGAAGRILLGSLDAGAETMLGGDTASVVLKRLKLVKFSPLWIR